VELRLVKTETAAAKPPLNVNWLELEISNTSSRPLWFIWPSKGNTELSSDGTLRAYTPWESSYLSVNHFDCSSAGGGEGEVSFLTFLEAIS
jgi:hypothetical protein